MFNLKKIESLLLLFILVVPMFISPNAYAVDGIIEETIESNTNPLVIDSISNDINPSTTEIKQDIDYNTAYQGESVKTEIEFNPQIIDHSSIDHFIGSGLPEYAFVTTAPYNSFADDEQEFNMNWIMDVADTDYLVYAYFKLYCGGVGTLSYEIFGRATDSVSATSTTTEADDTDTIYSDWLDSQGYAQLLFRGYGTTSGMSLNFFIVLPSTGAQVEFFDVSDLTSLADVEEILISIDVLSFTRSIITNNIRSDYKYSSATTITHKIDIPSTPHAKEIRVYTDLDYSSINPTASVTRVSDYWKIASPTELTYSVLFDSICSNLLTLEDVSKDYLTNVGFDDWTFNYGTFDLDTQKVFEGSHSLSIETSNTDYFNVSDDCDFEEDVDEFDIKLNGLPTLDTILHDSEYKLRLYTGGDGSDYGARRDNLNIDTNQYTLFATEITMIGGVKADRVKILLHFDDATVQEYIELIAVSTTEEFDFDITADKTIEMISIYYGDSVWDIGGGDRIYVSYIELLETGSEISLTLPEDDYYLSYSTFIESGSVTLTTDDRTLVNDDSITDRWINNFVFTHTDTVTFTIAFDDLDLTNFFDSFKIFQASTIIETLEPSQHQISATLIAWDGYQNPSAPNEEMNFYLGDDRRPTDYISRYQTVTNEQGVAAWNYNMGLDLTSYFIYAFATKNYWNPYLTQDIINDLTHWEGVGGDHYTESYDSETNEFEFVLMATAGYSYIKFVPAPYVHWYADLGFLVYELKTNDTGNSYTSRHYSYESPYTGTYRTNDTANTYWSDEYKQMFQHMDFWRWEGVPNYDAGFVYIMMNEFYTASAYVLWTIRDFHFSHAPVIQIEPQSAGQVEFAHTVIGDMWDWAEEDTEEYLTKSGTMEISLYDGCLNSTSTTSHDDYVSTYFHFPEYIDISDYDYFLIKVKGLEDTVNFRLGVIDLDGDYAYRVTETITNSEFFTFKYDLSYYDTYPDVDITQVKDFMIYFSNGTTWHSQSAGDGLLIDYFKIIKTDSFLDETNDYAHNEIHDFWDFEEHDATVNPYDDWWYSLYASTSWADGCLVLSENTATTYFGVKLELNTLDRYDDPFDATYYNLIATKLKFERGTFAENTYQFNIYIYDSDGDYVQAYWIQDTFDSDEFVYVFDLENPDYEFGTFDTSKADYLRFQWGATSWVHSSVVSIDWIQLIHKEEMPYSTIQNSVLLESETNDLQYNLYLDWNFIGTFADLSLIPFNSTVGTHYLQVQPFKTDDVYLTQNVYNYYYIVEADSFAVSVGSFYLSDTYVNTYVSSNFDFDYYVYEDDAPIGDGSGYKEGTTISSNRDTTAGATINYAIKFVYDSETIWFNTSYSNSRTAFYVESYVIDIGEEDIQIIWSTTKTTIDSLTIYEDTVLKVDADTTSPSSWVKSTTIGVHYVTLIFEATTYNNIIYSFNYEIVAEVFEVNVESFYLSETYVNTYITASENGNYQVFENNTAITSPAAFYWAGTSIQTDRNTTEGALVNYAIKFYNAETDTIWFNTTYSNTLGDFYVNDYSVNLGETTITIAWATSLPDSDYITVKEDGVTKIASDETSPTDWAKSVVVGTHVVTLLFQADGYTTITYSFNYHVYAVADFQVDVGSFQVSDDYVNTYVSSNYDGNYYVYEDDVQIDTGILYGAGTAIETNRDTTAAVTISYAIKFVYEAVEIWFNTSYSNPVTPFYLTDYRVDDGSTITITWDTTLPSLDSLTIYEDGDLKVDSDTESTSSWTKSIAVGNHYVTLIFSAEGYDDIIHSFAYVVLPPTVFSINIETFYVSDDYMNLYATANFDYTYTVYENSTEIGTGNGVATGTIIISPKNKEAGLYNFTVVFTYNSEEITFMTWYSNLIPPLHPLNTLYREQSQGFFNLSFYSSLDSYWIDIYHDDSLIIDDSTETFYAIQKATLVGWHNVTVHYIYNCSTDAEGYPVAEYNVTLIYEFWYEVKFFYDVRIRYIPDDIGLAIGEFNVNWVKTYLDGELVQTGDIDDVAEYSNYTFISNYDIRIKNTAASHSLVVKDLFDRTIYSTTLDISSFAYRVIELPIYRLGVMNMDNETHKFAVKPYLSDEAWQMSPELPQGVFIEFWFCYNIYIFRVYSVGTTYTDANGVLVKLWDEYEDLPPAMLPIVITIPLSYDADPPVDPEKIDIIIWIVAAILGVVVLGAIVYLIRRKIKKKLIK